MAVIDLTYNGVALSSAVPEAIVLDLVEPLLGTSRHTEVLVPGRAGSFTFNEEPGDRLLIAQFKIVAASREDRLLAQDAIAEWADTGTRARLIRSNRPDWYWWAIYQGSPPFGVKAHHADLEIQFLAGPYREAVDLSSQAESASANPGGGSFSIPDTVWAEPVVELTPAGGTITSVTLNVNGYTLTWEGLVGAGNVLTISSVSETVTLGANTDTMLTGAYNAANLDIADVAGAFPLLLPGSNTWSLSWTGTATSVAVDYTWRERKR